MNRYEFKVTYSTDRVETYEIETAQLSEAYHVLINCALNDADDDNEVLYKIELVSTTTIIWEIDEDE